MDRSEEEILRTMAWSMDEFSLKRNDNQRRHISSSKTSRISSFIIFFSIVLLINLCPFQTDDFYSEQTSGLLRDNYQSKSLLSDYLGYIRLLLATRADGQASGRVMLAEAKVLGKMAKVWYIKKKIKKLGKKLKKHTIAVPVFTAIPVYDPISHMGHVGHVGAMQHAASAYAPVIADQMTVAAALAAAQQQQQQQLQQQQQQQQQHQTEQHRSHDRNQLMASASNHQQMVMYHQPAHLAASQRRRPAAYTSHHAEAANGIINAYLPAPPLYVDKAGGLYGTYGNAYGIYDGGYHFW